MMFLSGNAAADADRGWFVGRFIPEAFRHQESVGIKWGVHKAGERNEGFAACEATSISILIEGEFQLTFMEEGSGDLQSIVLSNPGDYAIWNPGILHDWKAITDCVVLTVRWPSR